MLGSVKTYSQINLTATEVKKVNETYARLDSALAQGRLIIRDLKAYQDSTTIYRDSINYYKSKAQLFKAKRNRWRIVAITEAVLIALTSHK